MFTRIPVQLFKHYPGECVNRIMIRAPARTETKDKKGRPQSSTPLAGSGLKGGTSYLAFFSSSLPTSVIPSISGFKKFSRDIFKSGKCLVFLLYYRYNFFLFLDAFKKRIPYPR